MQRLLRYRWSQRQRVDKAPKSLYSAHAQASENEHVSGLFGDVFKGALLYVGR